MSISATLTDDEAVWRALADPTRRAILDLLRGRPLTTGELVAQFELSRFGVMKHLKALTQAGLVVIERRGRERLNHLNAVPIQAIYRRFIEPFAAPRADALLQLKDLAERDRGEPSMTATFDVREITLEVNIAASPERVWQALVGETSAWWHKDFYNHPAPSAFVIEERPGGRMYEDWGDGQGMVWATVTTVRKNELLQLSGELAPEFGGPSRGIHSFRLATNGDGTLLTFTDCYWGRVTEKGCSDMEQGWRFLFDECLKPYVEEGRSPERPESLAG